MKRWLCILILALVTAQGWARTKTTQANLLTASIVLDNIPDVADKADSDSLKADEAIDQHIITLRGFNKKVGDSKESFLVTNNSDQRMSAIRLTLRYSTLDDSMIHERDVVIPISLNAGETGVATIKTFDTQHMFYYYAGPKPRKSATPFKVAYRLTGYDITIGH